MHHSSSVRLPFALGAACILVALAVGPRTAAAAGSISAAPAATTHTDPVDFKLLSHNADQGDIGAQFELGDDYAFGLHVPRDYASAAEWWQKAAEKGDPVAQTDLGWLYFLGKGVPQDYTTAAKWWRKAADAGNAKAQGGLAWLYATGQGVGKHNVKAAKWALTSRAAGFERVSALISYLESQMTRGQIIRAQHLADQWWADHHKG